MKRCPVEGDDWFVGCDYDHRDAAFEEILHLVHDNGIGIDKARMTIRAPTARVSFSVGNLTGSEREISPSPKTFLEGTYAIKFYDAFGEDYETAPLAVGAGSARWSVACMRTSPAASVRLRWASAPPSIPPCAARAPPCAPVTTA